MSGAAARTGDFKKEYYKNLQIGVIYRVYRKNKPKVEHEKQYRESSIWNVRQIRK